MSPSINFHINGKTATFNWASVSPRPGARLSNGTLGNFTIRETVAHLLSIFLGSELFNHERHFAVCAISFQTWLHRPASMPCRVPVNSVHKTNTKVQATFHQLASRNHPLLCEPFLTTRTAAHPRSWWQCLCLYPRQAAIAICIVTLSSRYSL